MGCLKTNAKDQNNLSSVTATNREFDDAKVHLACIRMPIRNIYIQRVM